MEAIAVSMSNKRYTGELEAQAIKQVIEQGVTVVDVAARIDAPKHSLYSWVQAARTKRYAPAIVADASNRDSTEVRWLAELKCVTEERNILEEPSRTFPRAKYAVMGEHIPQFRLVSMRGLRITQDHH